jgi:hypothetical protein
VYWPWGCVASPYSAAISLHKSQQTHQSLYGLAYDGGSCSFLIIVDLIDQQTQLSFMILYRERQGKVNPFLTFGQGCCKVGNKKEPFTWYEWLKHAHSISTKGLSMKDITLSAALHLPNEALLFDLDALYTCLQTIPDHRDRRGVRYPLASLLMIGVLAKLAGQDSSRGMAHWAKLRTHELSQLFHLKRARMPHYSTWSRVLGHGVEPNEVEQVVGRFFAQASRTAQHKRGSIHLAIDGKTLRGTIPLGETEGVHRLSVYLPQQGVVLAQMNGEHKGREITFAPTRLAPDRFARSGGKFRCHVW